MLLERICYISIGFDRATGAYPNRTDSPTPSVHPIAILSARTPSTTTPASNGLTTMLFTFLLLLSTTLAFAIPPDPPAQHAFLPSSSLSPPPPLSLSNSTRLPLTLGVMSLCPDARLCESVMDRVFEQTTSIAVRGAGEGGGKKEGKVRVGELVELRVEFIASCVPSLLPFLPVG